MMRQVMEPCKVAIMDTGVDFSNPDIQHSLARDEINHPIMLDPDGQGIILTNATFFAYVDMKMKSYCEIIVNQLPSEI